MTQAEKAPSLFDTLQQMVKNKQKITKKRITARMEVQHLFHGVVREIDTTDSAAALAAAQRRLAAVKQKTEWQDVALALHILHTACHHCKEQTTNTEDLLVMRRRKDGILHYKAVHTTNGYEDLPVLALHRQVHVPVCHECRREFNEARFIGANARQLSLF